MHHPCTLHGTVLCVSVCCVTQIQSDVPRAVKLVTIFQFISSPACACALGYRPWILAHRITRTAVHSSNTKIMNNNNWRWIYRNDKVKLTKSICACVRVCVTVDVSPGGRTYCWILLPFNRCKYFREKSDWKWGCVNRSFCSWVRHIVTLQRLLISTMWSCVATTFS